MSSEYRIERWTEVAAPNAAMLRLRMIMEGYSVFQWADHPGTFYGPHKHETFQSHWVISGRLELTVAGSGTFELGPGDRDFMPPDTYHRRWVFAIRLLY
ncbi:cupin domain-containing protein [Leptolyngbya sp. 7M]|uniref:cupin domain-containing protein n=1 Tax=Leptolyngbya sp. 7M TaxID=2812896 RepID=UPI001B8B1463|nr:cupin domain-containing protein [Leptolyngbya sp. 7M]QYO68012.1 cupin domain-containing protein [Leptolyngbya sp. 7M]